MQAEGDRSAYPLRPHDRRGLRAAGIVPMTLADAVCWGHQVARICAACTRLQAPADYAGGFPAMNLLVPRAYLRQELAGPPMWFCAERRSNGTHASDASVGAGAGLVGTEGHHADTVPACADARNPGLLGAPL